MNDKNIHLDGFNGNAVELEAASWIAQLDRDEMTAADLQALREWSARSPKHISELKRLGQMWYDIDALIEQNIRHTPQSFSLVGTLVSAVKIRPKFASGLVAAIMAACFSVFLLFNTMNTQSEPIHYQASYSVPPGGNKIVDLSDGSKIHINTNSIIEVEYSSSRRIVRLISGEAHFDVAKDYDRPFQVYAGGNVLEAIGTAFAIRVDDAGTSLIVTEGIVQLRSLLLNEAAESTQINDKIQTPASDLVSAGQNIQMPKQITEAPPKIKVISPESIDKKLAWRKGLVIFDGESLSYVVEEVSRYTTTDIIITDPDIREMPFGGVFKTGEVDALLAALNTSYNIDVQYVNETLIHLNKSH